mmetsp:Transcript_127516/g.366833  ORF Transcript_127516/g.366833 Transcript_127516/m.366833 type:complete len:508 (+) Transcript_127516:66-1589(+)
MRAHGEPAAWQRPPQQSADFSQSTPAPVGPSQHLLVDLFPGKHSPPHLTKSLPQCLSAQPSPSGAHLPLQHCVPALHKLPTPVGPTQQVSVSSPGMHTPPHGMVPLSQCGSHPVPAATQTPPQQWSPASQRMPLPVGPSQQVASGTPGRHSPPHRIMPGLHFRSQDVPAAVQTPWQQWSPPEHNEPRPDGPTQHTASTLAGKHVPPQAMVPIPHESEQPWPAAAQTPSQHSAVTSHTMPTTPVTPRQHLLSSLPYMQTPPHLIMPGLHLSAQSSPLGTQTPSQHSAVASQTMPLPAGPIQQECDELPAMHWPPHRTIPGLHSSAHPVPLAMQTPPQHSSPSTQIIPFPVGPSQQDAFSAAAKHSPPQRISPGAQSSAQPRPSSKQTPEQHSAPAAHTMPLPEGPTQQVLSVSPTKHMPPQLTMPGAHGVLQPMPGAAHAPSQHEELASQRTPCPEGPRQQTLSSTPGKHSPPQESKPGAHLSAQPVPFAMQTPSQHSELAPQRFASP